MKPSTHEPSMSMAPTPGPTERKIFEEEFRGIDIGYVGIAGQFVEASPGLYNIQASGLDIWVRVYVVFISI